MEKGKRPPGSDPEVWEMLRQQKQSVGEEGILEQMAERRPTDNGASYVGTAKCGECHKSSLVAWQASQHSEAWASLLAREKLDGWPVTKHPDCVSCHVVGYGEKSGFINGAKTPQLANVGCENCHGAGSGHVAALQPLQQRIAAGAKITPEELAAARSKGKLPAATSNHCVVCHDFEQTPGFDFNDLWPQIEHGLDK
jgi:hypothetical protein